MRPAHRALIDYWIETGKVIVKRRVADDPGSKIDYFFVHRTGMELKLTASWKHFFKVFNMFNLHAFLSGEENYFDPWNNDRFISLSVKNIVPALDGEYQCLVHFEQEEIKKE